MILKEIDRQIYSLQMDSKITDSQDDIMIKMLRKKDDIKALFLDIRNVQLINHELLCFVLDLSKMLSLQEQRLIIIDPEMKLNRHLAMMRLNGIIDSFLSYDEALAAMSGKSAKTQAKTKTSEKILM